MDKKSKIKNARLRGLVYIISYSVLFVVLLVFSSYIHSKPNLNGVRVGEVLGILAFAMFGCLMWIIYGIILLVKGEKKTENTQNGQEENYQTENLQDKKEETQQNKQENNIENKQKNPQEICQNKNMKDNKTA